MIERVESPTEWGSVFSLFFFFFDSQYSDGGNKQCSISKYGSAGE
jgi:hypothetical protein